MASWRWGKPKTIRTILVVLIILVAFRCYQIMKFHYYTGVAIKSNVSTHKDINRTGDIKYIQMKRQLKLRTFCHANHKSMRQKYERARDLLYSDRQSVIYCYVPKVACTNWKRMMQVFDGKKVDPLDVGKEQVHLLKYSHLSELPKTEMEWRNNIYYSFVFVRHPFERLLSAYRNKLQKPYTDYFQRKYGSSILKLFRVNLTQQQYREGKNVTFKEFVDFVIHVYDKRGARDFDEHWQVMHTLCTPCTMKYNYVGKMETLLQDADEILREIGVYDKVKFPANATDKYKVKLKSLMERYYSTLTKTSVDKLYNIYKDDFLSFGYEIPDYLQKG